jgi:hypothetical protein
MYYKKNSPSSHMDNDSMGQVGKEHVATARQREPAREGMSGSIQ